MKLYRRPLAVASLAGLAVAALAYQAAITNLYADGKIISSNVKTIDGQLYVPVSDLNTYLGGTLKTTDDRVDITTAAGSTGLPETLAPTSIPAPMTFPVTETPPPPPPAPVTVSLNSDVAVGDFVYRVTRVDSTPTFYKEQFDQRASKLRPQWKTDKLVIVYLTVTNSGTQAGTPNMPGATGLTIFDEKGVGYPTTDLDIRQTSSVLGGGIDDYGDDYGYPVSTIAPGGQLSFAVVGSIPKDCQVKSVGFLLAAGATPTIQNPQNVNGANVTVNVG